MLSGKSNSKHFLPLSFLILYSVLLIFTGLDDSVLQADEGTDTFVTATLLKFGYPRHTDGINHTMDFADVYDGVFVYRTWLPYYLQAFSLKLFGQNTFAARLPFAVSGVLSVISLYFLALKMTGKKSVAFLAALYLSSSVPALLYFRTARYVSLPILLTILLVFFYLKLYEKGRWNPYPLIVTSILYFHTMYVELLGTIVGIILHFLLHHKKVSEENRKKILFCAGVVAVFTLPWLAFIFPVFSKVFEYYRLASPLVDTSYIGFFKHGLGFLFQLNNYIFPFILFPLLWLKSLRGFKFHIQLLVICSITIVATGALNSIPLQQYIVACFPLLFILLALVLMECFPDNQWPKAVAAGLLIATNVIHVGPLYPLKQIFSAKQNSALTGGYLQAAMGTFMQEIQFNSVYNNYWYEITHPYKGTMDVVVDFFRDHGKPGDICYIDREGAVLIFYSDLKLIRKEELSRTDKPDWIVLRQSQPSLELDDRPFSHIRNLKHIVRTNPYKKFTLTAPIWQINNSYEIQLHQFKTLSEKGKVHIYQLQNSS